MEEEERGEVGQGVSEGGQGCGRGEAVLGSEELASLRGQSMASTTRVLYMHLTSGNIVSSSFLLVQQFPVFRFPVPLAVAVTVAVAGEEEEKKANKHQQRVIQGQQVHY